jgi:hypothetical protein
MLPLNSTYCSAEVKFTEVFTTWYEVYGEQDRIKMCSGVNCSNLHMTFHSDTRVRKHTKLCSFKLLLFHKFCSFTQEVSHYKDNDQVQNSCSIHTAYEVFNIL